MRYISEKSVDRLVKEFNPETESVLAARRKRENLLREFYSHFPKEKLPELSLKTYCPGVPEHDGKDNFSWWLKTGLRSLGSFRLGNKQSFLICFNASTGTYSKHGFVKETEKDEDAMRNIAVELHNIVQTENIDKAREHFGYTFILKLLISYHPHKYFPVGNKENIDNALKIFNIDLTGLNVIEKNQKLYQIYLKKKEQYNSAIDNFVFQEILESVPKSRDTRIFSYR